MKKLLGFLKANPGKWLSLLLILQIALHAPFLRLPPCSIHVWRQCNTLAVARNFLEEDNRIIFPRVDRRGNQSGVTGMSFPAYEWTLAQVYRIFGTGNSVHRSLSLVLSMITLIAAAACFRRFTGHGWMGVAGAWAIAWSPEFFYHSINALPDVMAMTCGFCALWTGLIWMERRMMFHQLLSIFFLTLAGLIKMQYGLFGFFLGILLLHSHVRVARFRFLQLMVWLTGGSVSFILVIAWYRYANALIEASNLRDFVLQLRPISDPAKALQIVVKNLVSDLPELLLNYANTVLFLIGSWLFISRRNENGDWFWPIIVTGVAHLAWYLLMLEQMQAHQYYLMPSLLISTPLILLAVRYLDRFDWKVLLAVLLLVQPALAVARILPARWVKSDLGIPSEFADPVSLDLLKSSIRDPRWVITGPDQSGCIWLYFLHSKGFTFDDPRNLFEQDSNGPDLIRYQRDGARWLVTRRGQIKPEEAGAFRLNLRSSVGEMEVYRLE